ncbi:MAG: hypothetical protein H7282_05105 [Cytophagaceae bacterium]|nr:hypothetical protein [Cytophagaceae bacterium]
MKQNWPVIIIVVAFLAMGIYIYTLERRLQAQEQTEHVATVNKVFNEDSLSSAIEQRLQHRFDSVLSKKEVKIIYYTQEKKKVQHEIDSAGITSADMPTF